jgi:hypothetical protein
MYAWIEIDRASPDSMDPYFSGKGHEPRIQSPKLTSDHEVQMFVAAYAPEALSTEPSVTQSDPYVTHTITIALDPRAYTTAVYIHRYTEAVA